MLEKPPVLGRVKIDILEGNMHYKYEFSLKDEFVIADVAAVFNFWKNALFVKRQQNSLVCHLRLASLYPYFPFSFWLYPDFTVAF